MGFSTAGRTVNRERFKPSIGRFKKRFERCSKEPILGPRDELAEPARPHR